MKVLIIEDEQIAAERLERILKKIDPEIEIRDRIATVSGAIKWLSENKCDLIFLDIHLADGSSFGIFEQIEVDIPVIFTTAYDQYAIKAFQVNSIDYLLKPFNQQELEQSLSKFKRIFGEQSVKVNYKSLMEALVQRDLFYQKRFIVHSGQKIKTVPAEEIAYFYADEKMVFLVSFEKRNYVVDYTIDKLEQVLDPEAFFRINRRFIINIKAIYEMHAYPKSRVKIVLNPPSCHETIVSIERSAKFKQWLNK